MVLADRREFAVMAFLNAAGFDDEAQGEAMHPVRIRVREMVQKNLAKNSAKVQAWRLYYKKKSLGTHQYQDSALSLTADYPFKRIRPDAELGYRQTARTLSDLADVLNDFWVTADLDDVWSQVRSDYIAEINKYNFEKMRRQLSFVWEYLRMERSDSYTIVSIPNLLDSHYMAIGSRYENYYYSVESPGSYDYGLARRDRLQPLDPMSEILAVTVPG